MRKVDGGDFSDVEKVTTLLNMVIMVDMVDVMLLWMWLGCIRGTDAVLVYKEFGDSSLGT